jgi:hypothetical protein
VDGTVDGNVNVAVDGKRRFIGTLTFTAFPYPVPGMPAAVKKRYHGEKAVPLCFLRNNFLNNRYFSLQFKLDVNNTAIYTI